MIDRLIELIGREAALFESFLELLERQQAKLVASDADGLKQITVDLQEKVMESQVLDRRRRELVEEIRVVNGIEDDLNVTRILEMADQSQAARLTTLREQILGLNEEIGRTRDQNAMLLNRSRDYVMKTMELISRIGGPEGAYTPTGQTDAAAQTLAVDRRA